MLGSRSIVNWFFLLLVGLSQTLRAQDRGGKSTSFFVEAQGGATTYKSKLVDSNDTGTTLRYGVGSFAGSQGQLRFQIMLDGTSTNFLLNESKVALSWQDTSIRYHWPYAYLGMMFSRLEMTATDENTETIDAAGSGFGAVAGLTYGIGKKSQLGLDISQASLTKTTNALDPILRVSSRLDVDLGAQTDISKSFQFIFGYRIRNVSLSVDGTNYAEGISTTYIGLRYALSL